MRTIPSQPSSTVWLEAVVQTSKPASTAAGTNGRTEASIGRKSNPPPVLAASNSGSFQRRSPEVLIVTVRGSPDAESEEKAS